MIRIGIFIIEVLIDFMVCLMVVVIFLILVNVIFYLKVGECEFLVKMINVLKNF